jgi:hypothetical protein
LVVRIESVVVAHVKMVERHGRSTYKAEPGRRCEGNARPGSIHPSCGNGSPRKRVDRLLVPYNS